MKFTIVLATFLATSQATRIMDHTTGPAIPICNGANVGACTKANDVVIHNYRRDGKRAAKGDPDWED